MSNQINSMKEDMKKEMEKIRKEMALITGLIR